jgi:transposase
MEDAVVIGNEELQSAHTRALEFLGEVLSGSERRRRWSAEEKLRVLAQSVAPGSPLLTCRLHGISSGQFYTWRKQFRTGELTGFIPVAVASEPAAQLPPPETTVNMPLVSLAAPHRHGLIQVELPSGGKLLTGDIDEVVRRVLSALSPDQRGPGPRPRDGWLPRQPEHRSPMLSLSGYEQGLPHCRLILRDLR